MPKKTTSAAVVSPGAVKNITPITISAMPWMSASHHGNCRAAANAGSSTVIVIERTLHAAWWAGRA